MRLLVVVCAWFGSMAAFAATPTCPEELVRVGEKLRNQAFAKTVTADRIDAHEALIKGPVENLVAAREAASFLIKTAYPQEGTPEEGILRSSSPSMLLHRNRLRILLGAERRVPLTFLTDLESRTRRTSFAARALEERLWNFERDRLNKEPKFQPETVRQVVTIIAKVLERKEAKPLSDFVLHHYEDALSIVGISNEVDELRWKVISLLADEKLEREKNPEAGEKGGWVSHLRDTVVSWGQAIRNRFWVTPQWKKVSKDLLMALAASDHQPLDAGVLKGLSAFGYSISVPVRRQHYQMHLAALIQREQELTESLVSYFRHYRAATLLKKILHDLACSDGKNPLESYSVARQAMQWSLSDHPYVRHVVESGLVGTNEVYHPYLCVALPLKRDMANVEDPVLAAQALTPEILEALYGESRRVGLEALVREWDARAADETLAEVEKILKASLVSVGSKVLTSAAATDPIYERLIGPALAPILERLKNGGDVKPNATSTSTSENYGFDQADDSSDGEPREKKKRRNEPLDPWNEAEETRPGKGEKEKEKPAEKEKEKPKEKEKEKEEKPSKPMAVEPLSLLLKRIQEYLGPDSTRIAWETVRKGTPPERTDDFAKAYAWVDGVYEVLNQRAEAIREADLGLESLAETEKLGQNGAMTLWDKERTEIAKQRHDLISTFLNVQHAIEACIIGQQGMRGRSATDEQIAGDALRVGVFFLKKHRSLGRFLVNHSHLDPSLRELWVRLFVRMASGHLDLSPHLPFPLPNTSDSVPSLWQRWGKIAAYGCAVTAITVGGAVVMTTKGCTIDRPPANQPVVTSPADQPQKPITESRTAHPRRPGGQTSPAAVNPAPGGEMMPAQKSVSN